MFKKLTLILISCFIFNASTQANQENLYVQPISVTIKNDMNEGEFNEPCTIHIYGDNQSIFISSQTRITLSLIPGTYKAVVTWKDKKTKKIDFEVGFITFSTSGLYLTEDHFRAPSNQPQNQDELRDWINS
jgi:hypothetical protein